MVQQANNPVIKSKPRRPPVSIGQLLVMIGLFLTAFSLPLLDWRFYLSGFEFNISDFLILLTAVIYFISRIFSQLSGQPVRAWRWPLAWPAAIFLAIILLSSVLSPWPVAALKYSLRVIVFVYLFYIALPFNALDSWPKWRWPLAGAIIAGIYSSVIGLWSLRWQDLHDAFFRVQPMAIFGHWWLGSNHNLLAEFLVISNFFLLAWGRFSKNDRQRRILDIVFIISVVITLLTFSRAAWIVMIIQLVLWWLSINNRRQRIGWLLAAALLVVVITPLWLKMDSLQTANYSSTENRVLLTQIAWEKVQQKPFLGWGSGQFLQLVDNNLRFRAKYGDPIDSHGVLQKVAAENGIIGLIALAILFVSLVAIWWRAWLNNPKARSWLTPLIIGALGGLLFQLFNTSYYKGKVWLPVALSLAAIQLLAYEKKAKP
ncbi:MAG TPA: O-antigen ligase family protein [bacterium]|nr:O-antigen ligase family protein [bacterium]HOF79773.1 O-antigen ligase family protein [bacterium]HOQ91616.1 O-antigen ligase family protein [bacterium]HPL22292.1 O-antigen ligase family protein [bacterium]HPX64201.1 O-antigen ligase family protein [bacterium]